MLPKSSIMMIVMAIILFAVQALANGGSEVPIASTDGHKDPGMDFSDFLKTDSTVHPRVKTALQTIDKFNELPSCQRMAFAGLMTSCAVLETGSDDDGNLVNDPTLAKQTQLYAVRLAVCERSEANAPAPQACKSFIPTVETTKRQGFFGYFSAGDSRQKIVSYPDYEEATKENLPACLAEMQKDGQLWNSYSNAMQTVATLCHAVRPQVERERLLHLHKALNNDMEANFDTLRIINEYGRETALAWQELVKMAHETLVDFHKESEEASARVLKMFGDLEEAVRARVEEITQSVRQTDAVLQDTNEQARAALHYIANLKEVALQANAVIDRTRTDLEAASNSVEIRENKINYLFELYQQQMMQIFNEVSRFFETLEELSVRSSNVGARLEGVDVLLGNIDEKLNDTLYSMSKLDDQISGLAAVGQIVNSAFGFLPVTWQYILTYGPIILGLLVAKYCVGISFTTVLRAPRFACECVLGPPGTSLNTMAKSVTFVILTVVITAYYCLDTDMAKSLMAQWRSLQLSPAEYAGWAFAICFISVMLACGTCAFLSPRDQPEEQLPEVEPEPEKKRFWFNNPKSTAFQNWAV